MSSEQCNIVELEVQSEWPSDDRRPDCARNVLFWVVSSASSAQLALITFLITSSIHALRSDPGRRQLTVTQQPRTLRTFWKPPLTFRRVQMNETAYDRKSVETKTEKLLRHQVVFNILLMQISTESFRLQERREKPIWWRQISYKTLGILNSTNSSLKRRASKSLAKTERRKIQKLDVCIHFYLGTIILT